jgi:hypothetical protein
MLLHAFNTELTVRGSYHFYSADPLTTGRFTEEELAQYETRLTDTTQQTRVSDQNATYLVQTLAGRLLQADAVSGLATAPVRFELRAALAHELGTRWRGQLSYTFAEYVPTQGRGHVLSTKWTFRASDTLRFWAALAAQRDLPLAPSVPTTEALATLGAEYSF